MNTILSYVSQNSHMGIPMREEFARVALDLTAGENILYGRKYFEQDMQETGMPNTKTFVLSRSHKFTGAKAVREPYDFHNGYIIGGRSTISSMMPYSDNLILGVDNKTFEENKPGPYFPAINNWKVMEVLPGDGYTIFMYRKVGFSK